jgi:FkbM family methyltransferase
MVFRNLRNNYRILRRSWRALRGRDLLQRPQIKCPTQTLGDDGAAWNICPDSLSANSVVYSFGVGEEVSFDLALIRYFGVTIHAFDPTPRSVEWVRVNISPQKFVFHPYGVAGEDGMRKFLPPVDPLHISHTLLERDSPWPAVEVQVHRLATILRSLKHEHIDLLKMDIEGAEYEVIEDIIHSKISIGQLLVEFHHRWKEIGVDKTRTAIRDLNAAGYRIFSISSSGEEFGFLKVC